MTAVPSNAARKIKQCRSLLFFMMVLAVVGLVMDLTKHWGESEVILPVILLNSTLIAAYLIAALRVAKRPVPMSILAMGTYLLVQLLSFIGDPENYGGNAFWKILALLVLVTIFINARNAQREMNTN